MNVHFLVVFKSKNKITVADLGQSISNNFDRYGLKPRLLDGRSSCAKFVDFMNQALSTSIPYERLKKLYKSKHKQLNLKVIHEKQKQWIVYVVTAREMKKLRKFGISFHQGENEKSSKWFWLTKQLPDSHESLSLSAVVTGTIILGACMGSPNT